MKRLGSCWKICAFLSLLENIVLHDSCFWFPHNGQYEPIVPGIPCDKPRKRKEQGRVFGKSRYAFVCICVLLFPLLGEGFERKPVFLLNMLQRRGHLISTRADSRLPAALVGIGAYALCLLGLLLGRAPSRGCFDTSTFGR